MKKAIISKAIAFGLTALERHLPATTKAFSGFLRFSFASLSALNFISSPREPEGSKLQESDGLLTRSAPKRKGAKTVDAPPKRSGPDQTSAEE